LKIFQSYGNVTIAGEGLQNLGLCSAIKAFEQEEIFIMPHQLRHGVLVSPSHSKDRPYLIASYVSNVTQGDAEDLL
jgi:hypothetical protein